MEKFSKLFNAVRDGNLSKVMHLTLNRFLFGHKVNVNDRDSNEETALKLAAGNGYTEIVRVLIDKGADVNAKNNEGSTAKDKNLLFPSELNSRPWR